MAIGTSTLRMAELSVWVGHRLPYHLFKMGVVFLHAESDRDVRTDWHRLRLIFSLKADPVDATDGLVLCAAQDPEVGALLARYKERMDAICQADPSFRGVRINTAPHLQSPFDDVLSAGLQLSSAFVPVKQYFEEKMTQAYNVALSSHVPPNEYR